MSAPMANELTAMTAALSASIEQFTAVSATFHRVVTLLDQGALVGEPVARFQSAFENDLLPFVARTEAKLRDMTRDLEDILQPDEAQVPYNRLRDPAQVMLSAGEEMRLAHWLALFAPDLPPALITPKAEAHWRAFTAQFPAAFASSCLLECRLAANQPLIDLCLGVDPERDQGRTLLADQAFVNALPVEGVARQAWTQIHNLAATWSDPDSELHTAIQRVWLEFDQADHDAAQATPAVFIKLDAEAVEPEARLALVEKTLTALQGAALDPAQQAVVERCFAALPEGAVLRWLGAMLSRPDHPIRLNFELPADAIEDYLVTIGWDGPHAALTELLDRITNLVDLTVLVIEIAEGQLQPQIGFECLYDHFRQPESEPRWTEYLAALAAAGWGDPIKTDACLNWGGYFHTPLPHVTTPQVLQRWLNHVKLTLHPSGMVDAKVYLLMDHRPTRLERFKQPLPFESV